VSAGALSFSVVQAKDTRGQLMNAQDNFQLWQERIRPLNISENYSDLLELLRAISDLNLITQQAEKENN